MNRKILVIGGGASGMMAAIIAARRGGQVVILEQNDRLGKKLLSTGNGKCNFTNKNQSIKFYHTDRPQTAEAALKQFPLADTLAFFEELGVLPLEKRGGYYPNSEQASAMLDVLRFEVERLGISVLSGRKVWKIEPVKKGFRLFCKNKEGQKTEIFGDKVILAAGSKASAVSGSDGSSYRLAKELGHRIIEPLPALVQLKCRESFYKGLAGVRLQAEVKLFKEKGHKLIASDRGEVQLTAYGVSGIPVFQISRFAAKALHEGEKLYLLLDFLPDMGEEAVYELLKKRQALHEKYSMEQFFIGMLHKKLAAVLLKRCQIAPAALCGDIDEARLKLLTEEIKAFKTEITATQGFEQAQVCCGGIDLRDVDGETLESCLVSGLYFAGECLDVDGACGGYNLQWAWASGYVAGQSSM